MVSLAGLSAVYPGYLEARRTSAGTDYTQALADRLRAAEERANAERAQEQGAKALLGRALTTMGGQPAAPLPPMPGEGSVPRADLTAIERQTPFGERFGAWNQATSPTGRLGAYEPAPEAPAAPTAGTGAPVSLPTGGGVAAPPGQGTGGAPTGFPANPGELLTGIMRASPNASPQQVMESFKRGVDLLQPFWQSQIRYGGGETAVGPLEGGAEARAAAIASGRARLPSGYSMRSPEMRRVVNRAYELNPDLDATTYEGRVSGTRVLSNRVANLELAAAEAETLIPRVREASANVDRTQFPTLNSLLLAADKGVGGENVIKLGIAINSLIYVYARILKPVGVLSDVDTKRASDILEAKWSKGQIDAALNQMQKEIESAQQGVVRAQERVGGGAKKQAPREPAASAPAPAGAPPVGHVEDGFRFRGGDPSKAESWEPVSQGGR